MCFIRRVPPGSEADLAHELLQRRLELRAVEAVVHGGVAAAETGNLHPRQLWTVQKIQGGKVQVPEKHF